jgi:regulator of sigma E protease
LENPSGPDRLNNDADPSTPTRSWLARNGPFLVIGAALILAFLYYTDFDLDVPLKILITAVGLGLVIFIHELGHFLVAKWCDVHVEVFSIGFGPPLPGCAFKWGETTYMIAVFPLGGYVKMVGEGPSDEEGDDDPRSFKNKPVWQRMAIISAGVTMNLILAFVCFVIVFRTHGDEQIPSLIGGIDTGSPLWKLGTRSREEIYWVGNAGPRPSFREDLQATVMNSQKGVPLRFVYGPPNSPESEWVHTEIEPQRGEGDLKPAIGVFPPFQPQLWPASARKEHSLPVKYFSAAAAAEPPFQFDDEIIGASDPAKGGQVTELPPDPANAKHRDYFTLHDRMCRLAGQPMTFQVKREKSGEVVDIKVPPAFHYTLGARMRMGKITAVRDQSPAAKAGVLPGDIIEQVEIRDGNDRLLIDNLPAPEGVRHLDLDPERLPFELAQWAARQKDSPEVTLTVLRKTAPPNHNEQQSVKLKLTWDDSWRCNRDMVLNISSPWPIPGLGLAYLVETTVVAVAPGSPAELAGLKKDDIIKAVRIQQSGKTPKDKPRIDKQEWQELKSDQWARVAYAFQYEAEYKDLMVRVERDKAELTIQAAEDTSWPLKDYGLLFNFDERLQKATTLGQALVMGFHKTTNFVATIYGNLRSIATFRVSPKVFGGPILIAQAGYHFAGNIYRFLVFLGIIGVNLAVVNFLPIPVLDGGHMVFLIYEKLRGKPPPEQVRFAATMVGMSLILLLMAGVIYLDVSRLVSQ